MNMPLKKSAMALVSPAPAATAKILSLRAPKRPALMDRLKLHASAAAVRLVLRLQEMLQARGKTVELPAALRKSDGSRPRSDGTPATGRSWLDRLRARTHR